MLCLAIEKIELLSLPEKPHLSVSFYFVSMVISVILLLLVFLLTKDLLITGFILIAALLIFLIIGAFKLRQDEALSENNFLQLIKLVFEQIPSLGKELYYEISVSKDVTGEATNTIESLHRQLAIHRSNLNKLKEDAAIYGTGAVPLHLKNQIEAEEKMIMEIEAELAEIRKFE